MEFAWITNCVNIIDWKYAPKDQHVLYTTTANDIGKIVPAATDLPHQRYGRSKKFTAHLAQAGPYRNCSLNTK
ncbi:hypothetical protein BC828DRAFT_374417 [Blastocladiella britannica]|nr:hypothetical protein BC828DRAFT_374417 [Blastocladiella britannica]